MGGWVGEGGSWRKRNNITAAGFRSPHHNTGLPIVFWATLHSYDVWETALEKQVNRISCLLHTPFIRLFVFVVPMDCVFVLWDTINSANFFFYLWLSKNSWQDTFVLLHNWTIRQLISGGEQTAREAVDACTPVDGWGGEEVSLGASRRGVLKEVRHHQKGKGPLCLCPCTISRGGRQHGDSWAEQGRLYRDTAHFCAASADPSPYVPEYNRLKWFCEWSVASGSV